MDDCSIANFSMALQAWERHCADEKAEFIRKWIENRRRETGLKLETCKGCGQTFSSLEYFPFCSLVCLDLTIHREKLRIIRSGGTPHNV